MASVSIRSVKKNFGDVPILHGVDIEIKDGSFTVLVGPSGCGKSTLLRMIAGLEEVTSGEIHIGNNKVNDLPPKERDIAMVFQNYALYPHMTVGENMAFGLRVLGSDKAEIDRKVKEAAEILQLTPLLDRLPKALSGGQRQRVAMGRAIVRQPQAFLMDEPLSNLDAKLRVQMRTEIKELHQRLKTTSIYVTHDQIEAMTMADRIVLLSNKPTDGFRAKYKLLHTVRTQDNSEAGHRVVYQCEDSRTNLGCALGKDITKVAGKALLTNFTILGPRVLPIREQLRTIASYAHRWFVKNANSFADSRRWKSLPFASNIGGDAQVVAQANDGSVTPDAKAARAATQPGRYALPAQYVPDFKRAVQHFCIHAGGRAVIDGIAIDKWTTRLTTEPKADLQQFLTLYPDVSDGVPAELEKMRVELTPLPGPKLQELVQDVGNLTPDLVQKIKAVYGVN